MEVAILEDQIRNMIIANEIHLLDDHTDLNIHFAYKGYEVSTNTNIPYTYKRKSNPLGLIEQKLSDRSKESVQQDYFRELVIHMPIDKLIENDDDDSDDDIFESDYAEENLDNDIEDDEEYEDEVRNHFPGLYLTSKQEELYAKAGERIYVLIGIMEDEVRDIYQFVSEFGLTMFPDKIVFYAPQRSKSTYEWISWCIRIIDKVLNFFKDEDDEELFDDEDESIDEVM